MLKYKPISSGWPLSEFGPPPILVRLVDGYHCISRHKTDMTSVGYAWLFAGEKAGLPALHHCEGWELYPGQEGAQVTPGLGAFTAGNSAVACSWAISLPYRSCAGSPRPADMFDAPSQSVACRCALRQNPTFCGRALTSADPVNGHEKSLELLLCENLPRLTDNCLAFYLHVQLLVWQCSNLHACSCGCLGPVRPDLVPLCVHPRVVANIGKEDCGVHHSFQSALSISGSSDDSLDVSEDGSSLQGAVEFIGSVLSGRAALIGTVSSSTGCAGDKYCPRCAGNSPGMGIVRKALGARRR